MSLMMNLVRGCYMTSLKPTLANPDINTRRIQFYLLLMSASSCSMLVPGVVQIDPDGSASLLSTANMDIWLSWLHRMTECWTDKSEALSSMRKYIGKFRISVSSARFSRPFYIKKFSSQYGAGIRSRKEWVCICLFRKRDILGFMILVLFLTILAIMG